MKVMKRPISSILLERESKVRRVLRRISPLSRRDDRSRHLMRSKFYDELWQQVSDRIGARLDRLPGGFFRISVPEKSTIVLRSMVNIDSALTLKIAGNKALVYRLLSEMEYGCVPRYFTYSCSEYQKAKDFLDAHGGPVVVKPASGTGAGSGVTTGIMTPRQLYRASALAASFGEQILVEEQFEGESYRLLLLDGVLIDAIQRCPPKVHGDGKSTISKLVDIENSRRRTSGGGISVSVVDKDAEMRSFLAEQSLNLSSVPADGQSVIIKRVINQNSAEDNHRVFDQVHFSFVELCKKMAVGMGIQFAGIDIIAPDISRPAEDQSFLVNEINTSPGIHHHYLVSKTSVERDVAEIVMRFILFDEQQG